MSWQVSSHEIAGRAWDVVVIGCGPAGAVAAKQLAEGGVAVAALERSAFPRDKVCGDALIPDALGVLSRIGLLDRVSACGHAPARLRFVSPSAIDVSLRVNARVVRRSVLDALLAQAAAEAGAVVAHASAESVTAAGDRAIVTLRDGAEVAARIVVVATGADLRLLNGMRPVNRAIPTGVAVRCYIRSRAEVEDLTVAFDPKFPHGYAWIFPLGDGQYNIGCGISALGKQRTDLSRELDRFLERSSVARDVRRGIASRSPLAGAILRAGLQGAPPRAAPNILVAGEAVGATFPLTGEGIGKAMETGERAAAAILQALSRGDLGELQAYDAYIESLKPLYRGYDIAERWLARPWLNDLLSALVRGSPHTIAQLEGILGETVDPKTVFSMRGVWKMLTR